MPKGKSKIADEAFREEEAKPVVQKWVLDERVRQANMARQREQRLQRDAAKDNQS